MDVTPQECTLEEIEQLITNIRTAAMKSQHNLQLIGGTLNCLMGVLGSGKLAQIQFALMLMGYGHQRMHEMMASGKGPAQ